MDAGLVLVLDGPTGVGRSTTIAALQDAWPRVRRGPLLEVGLDRTFGALGRARWRWWDLIEHHEPAGDEELARVGWGPLGRELVRTMHRSAATWARAGFDVAVDHVLLDRATETDLRDALEDLEVIHVGMTCDLEVLEDRVEAPADGEASDAVRRRRERAVAEWARSREVRGRDGTVDLTEATTEEVVEALLRVVARRLGPVPGHLRDVPR